MTGAGHDACVQRRVTAEASSLGVEDVTRLVGTIADPAVRAATVTGWLRTRRTKFEATELAPLCALVDGEAKAACERRGAR